MGHGLRTGRLFFGRFHAEFDVGPLPFGNDAAMALAPTPAFAGIRRHLQEGGDNKARRDQTDKRPDKPISAHSELFMG